jgi:hypothetical protein
VIGEILDADQAAAPPIRQAARPASHGLPRSDTGFGRFRSQAGVSGGPYGCTQSMVSGCRLALTAPDASFYALLTFRSALRFAGDGVTR